MNRLCSTFCISMGIYGANRGYRASLASTTVRPVLTTHKIANSVMNGLLYSIPMYNFVPLVRLLNRIEIDKSQLDKTLFCEQYTEFGGAILYDTV